MRSRLWRSRWLPLGPAPRHRRLGHPLPALYQWKVLNLPAARPDIAVRAAGDLHLSGGVMVGQRQFGDLLQPGKPPYLEQSPPRATRARAGAGRAALIASTGGPGPAGGSRERAGQLCALEVGPP